MQEDENSPHNYNAIRRAAEVHRQVRQYARAHIQPGMQMTDIADMIENGTRALVEENGMKSGIGFPTGLSRNHCAAHWTPNAGDKTGEGWDPMKTQEIRIFRGWIAADVWCLFPNPCSHSSASGGCIEGRLWSARQRPDRRLGLHAQLGTDVRQLAQGRAGSDRDGCQGAPPAPPPLAESRLIDAHRSA